MKSYIYHVKDKNGFDVYGEESAPTKIKLERKLKIWYNKIIKII